VAQPDPNSARTQRDEYPRLIPGYRDLLERCSWALPTNRAHAADDGPFAPHPSRPGTLSVVRRSVEPLRRVPRKWVGLRTLPIAYVDMSEVRPGRLEELETAMDDLARFV
jgi:hypothetical protein